MERSGQGRARPAGPPRSLRPCGRPRGSPGAVRGDDHLGTRDAGGLHRREPDRPCRVQHEHAVVGLRAGAPDDRKPAGEAGGAARSGQLVGDVVGDRGRDLLGHDRELGQRAVAVSPETVARDVDAGIRGERVGLDDPRHPSEPAVYGVGGDPP